MFLAREKTFLMSYPRPDWTVRGGSNFKSQAALASHPSPRGAALAEWIQLADEMHRLGATILVVPPPPHLPLTGLPFTAEAGCLAPGRSPREFWLPHLTPPHRAEERTYLAGFLSALGWRLKTTVARWEGQGDLFWLSPEQAIHTYGVGPAARTDAASFPEVATAFSTDAISIGFHADPWFHGNTWLGIYQSPRAEKPVCIYCPEALLPGEESRLRQFLGNVPAHPISRADSVAYATNALQVGDRVIAPRGLSPEIHALWRALDLDVIELPFTHLFGRAGGAAVCLSNRLHGVSAGELPESLLYAQARSAIVATS